MLTTSPSPSAQTTSEQIQELKKVMYSFVDKKKMKKTTYSNDMRGDNTFSQEWKWITTIEKVKQEVAYALRLQESSGLTEAMSSWSSEEIRATLIVGSNTYSIHSKQSEWGDFRNSSTTQISYSKNGSERVSVKSRGTQLDEKSFSYLKTLLEAIKDVVENGQIDAEEKIAIDEEDMISLG